ncbi:hypothetical protein DPF85_05910 [Limosilactobacillus fermentum]|uniref:hypothetical protein n=1 Tax=Limosilactobacillus fermentum TaxID=1613 RepID=UPI000DBFF81F|nr:hypothetical protein [Limosilactobacillus fermentum]RAM09875.1 hypothetical protein DPF85_05910 [Limosilactobacillus fermentum]
MSEGLKRIVETMIDKGVIKMINDKKEEAFANLIKDLSTEALSELFPVMGVNSIKVENTKNGFTAVVEFDDGVVAYPTLWCKSRNQVYLVVIDWALEIHEQATDNRNYGLLFYACGYNGKAQTETKQLYERKGIEII